MRRDTVVSAPKHVRIEAPDVASGTTQPDTHGSGNRRAYYTAMGKLALENIRHTLDWWVNALRLPSDRNRRDDERHPHEH